MIYLDDIRAADVTARFDEEYVENKKFFEANRAEVDTMLAQVERMKMFDIFTEDAQARTKGGIIGAIQKLGQKILQIIESAKNFITDKIAEVKKALWDNKSTDQKLRELKRKNPKAAEEVRIAVEKGDLNFMSYSDFSDFYKNIDEILAGIRKGNTDPKSLKAKVEKLKSFGAKAGQVALKVAPIIISAGTLYLTYRKYRDSRAEEEARKISQQHVDALNEAKLLTEQLSAEVSRLNQQKISQEMQINRQKMTMNRTSAANTAADRSRDASERARRSAFERQAANATRARMQIDTHLDTHLNQQYTNAQIVGEIVNILNSVVGPKVYNRMRFDVKVNNAFQQQFQTLLNQANANHANNSAADSNALRHQAARQAAHSVLDNYQRDLRNLADPLRGGRNNN